jgi:hypothetical protein
VIGKRNFLYDLWGDVVNTASRMESHGKPGRIQVADAIQQRLGQPFELEKRGVTDVKGKGEIHTWFLNGRNGRNGQAVLSPSFSELNFLRNGSGGQVRVMCRFDGRLQRIEQV